MLFCLFTLLCFATAQSQPIPKTTFGVTGGMILTGDAGSNRVAGGRNSVSSTLLGNSKFFFGVIGASGGITTTEGNFTSENKPGIFAGVSFNTMLDTSWQVGVCVGQIFGKAKGTFIATINYPDTVTPQKEFAGTLESDVKGWVAELGVRYFFDASFHPFVGIGGRYSTQTMSSSTITVNGASGTFGEITGVDEFGGFINAGVKIPLMHTLFLDAEVDGIIRSGTEFEKEKISETSKISFEPAFRIGLSYDIGQFFSSERYGEEDEAPVKKATQKP